MGRNRRLQKEKRRTGQLECLKELFEDDEVEES